MCRFLLFSCILLVFPSVIFTARILGIFPMPSVSHQAVFREYTKQLAKHGHELVILTPNPDFYQEISLNITKIDVSASYKVLAAKYKKPIMKLKRGVIVEKAETTTLQMFKGIIEMIKDELNHPTLQEILHDKNQKFDLIVVEAILDYTLVVSHFIKAPVVLISSFYGTPENFATIGAVSSHPIYYPNFFRSNFGNSFMDKLYGIYREWILKSEFDELSEHMEKVMKQEYGGDISSLSELRDKVELFFVNSYPMFDNNRPVPSNVVYLGGMHLEPVKELPKDLKDFLDNSERGVIYVSLGTNVRLSLMDKEMLEAFIEAFGELPYDILWKFDLPDVQLPKNIKIQKWFPQRDLLHHPNIKIFVTQGGLQSSDEAIDAAVPLVGIPILGDQWYTVKKHVELGIGMGVDAETLTKEKLVAAILEVVRNKSYKENILKLRELVNDQPDTSVERAVWWTEHVIRHGGARHLRTPAANVFLYDYFMLDIVIPVLAFVTLVLILILYAIYYLVLVMRVRFTPKMKIN